MYIRLIKKKDMFLLCFLWVHYLHCPYFFVFYYFIFHYLYYLNFRSSIFSLLKTTSLLRI